MVARPLPTLPPVEKPCKSQMQAAVLNGFGQIPTKSPHRLGLIPVRSLHYNAAESIPNRGPLDDSVIILREGQCMSGHLPGKAYRVVAYWSDGTIGFAQEHLPPDVAIAFQEQLLLKFHKVLLQDQRLSLDRDGDIPDWSFESNCESN